LAADAQVAYAEGFARIRTVTIDAASARAIGYVEIWHRDVDGAAVAAVDGQVDFWGVDCNGHVQ
jgi:hypothetical protein